MSNGRLVLRILGVGASAVAAVALLVALAAWVALRVQWEVPDPAALTGPTEILARDGSVLTRFTSEVDRRVVSLDQVSPVAAAAIVTSEDERFYEHEGVDVPSLLRAVVTNLRTGSIRQGGSTITQQYVKNAFVGTERTLTRKIREAVISIQLERDRSKDEILESYLNTVYFGEGAYGIEAAALTYFGVHASELTAAQAATLAQLLPAPSTRNPRVDPGGARARRDGVLRDMGELGRLPPVEVDAATAAPLEVRPREHAPVPHPFFVRYVRQQLEAAYGEEAVLTGSLRVLTTLDPARQQRVREGVDEHLPPTETGIEAGAAAIDPRSGEVLGLYSGRDFYGDTSTYSAEDYSQVDLATQGLRQPGSTFKPIVLAAALEQGVEPDREYDAPARITIGGSWSVGNADGRGYGRLPLDEAMVSSVNTVYAQLGADVGARAMAEMAQRLGVRNPLAADVSLALGAIETSVLDLASVFATLANDGLACPAHTILEVRGRDGNPIDPPQERRPPDEVLDARPDGLAELDEGRCYQAVDPDIARTVNRILVEVVERGTGTRAQVGRPQAGKTGTSQENRDAWFAGYTPSLATVVWVGDPDESRSMEGIAGYDAVFGGTIPAEMWKAIATRLLEGVPPEPFPEPGALDRDERGPGAPMSRDDGDPRGEDGTPSPSPGGPSPGPSGSPSPEPSDGSPSPGDPSPTDSPSDDDDDGACIPPVVTEGCP